MARRKSHRVARRSKPAHPKRDYAAEYARRISRATARGLSRAQARGHPKPGESALSSRRRPADLDDKRLQRGLRILRQDKNLRAAARAIGVSPERLKHTAATKGAITKEGRRWVLNPSLPRRVPIYTRGRVAHITVGDKSAASLVGRYMAAVGNFLASNDRNFIKPFVGQSVTDISGKSYSLETNPNALYRLASAGGESFEAVYRIVI
jgi:hypothetical protein